LEPNVALLWLLLLLCVYEMYVLYLGQETAILIDVFCGFQGSTLKWATFSSTHIILRIFILIFFL